MQVCALLKKNYKQNMRSTYYGDKEYKDRSAEVYKDERGFFVRFYRHDSCVEERHLFEHSETYAENAAENWVMGVIQ
jgi:dTDP-4-dehydrorhamnose 3,5-epimerase-like enzyme